MDRLVIWIPRIRCFALATVVAMSGVLPLAANADGLPAPKGLYPCPPGDRIASAEANIALRMRGQFLGCFRSHGTVTQRGLHDVHSEPREYAFAMRLPGGPYTSKALGQLLVNVRGQWAGFEPLSQDFRDYTSAVNKLTHGNTGGGSVDTSITSIKPVLIAIDPLGPNAYSVVSLRTYNFTAGSRALKSVKVDADAVALVHTTLVRLTLLRDARSAEDVTDAKAQIASWARSLTATKGSR